MTNSALNEPLRIMRQIRELISRQGMVEDVTAKQTGHGKQSLVETLTRRQYQGEVYQLLNRLHPSDIATLLEQLPPSQCQFIWRLIDASTLGAVILELSDSLRKTLIDDLHMEDLVSATQHLDSDEIVDLVQDLPSNISDDLLTALPLQTREHVQSTLRFPEDTVGAWMEFDYLVVTENATLDSILTELRQKGSLPDDSGKVFVIDAQGEYKGMLSVNDLLLKSGDLRVDELMDMDAPIFHTTDSVESAARDFERYELSVAPVVNIHNKLVGALRVNPLMEMMEELNRRTFMAQAGLTKEESLFEPYMQSAKNRWPWIALNLMIVFIASRIINQFETTIAGMVALAALLPITANIGGNSGNQVVALVIRGLALNQLDRSNLIRLFQKEISVAAINGSMWGVITGLITFILYGEANLAIVITLAMLMTILFTALMGVSIPLILKKLNQDPALGSSIIITGFADTVGFLIFLGLASVMLHL